MSGERKMGKDSEKSGGIKIYATLFWEFFQIGIFTIGEVWR